MSDLGKQLSLQKLIKEIIQEVGDLGNIPSYDFTYSRYRRLGMGDSKIGSFYTSDTDKVTMFIRDITEEAPDAGLKIPPIFKQTGKGLEEEEIPIFDIVYTVEGKATQHRKTSLSKLYRILKTILEFVKIAIPDIIQQVGEHAVFLISSQAKDSEDFMPSPQKDALYWEIFVKNLPPGEYRTARLTFEGKPIILFQKKKTRN